MQRRPYGRVHQEKISDLRQETQSVLEVLAVQVKILGELEEKTLEEKRPGGSSAETRESQFLQQCSAMLGDKITNFENLEHYLMDFGAFVSTLRLLLILTTSPFQVYCIS